MPDGKIIEIKGYEAAESVARKNKIAEDNGYEIVVLYKEDLVKEFEWVKRNYTCRHMHELYDDHKPRFTYTCSGCGSEYGSEVNKKVGENYCSRECVWKHSNPTKNAPIV